MNEFPAPGTAPSTKIGFSASSSRASPAPAQPWADLPKVLELAKRKNAVTKVTGASC